MADEAVDDFKSSLTDLTFNSKPLINMLTMLAEENSQYAEQIVGVIEEHIRQVVPAQKLPALYLIDSVIKNISESNYLQLFTKNIVNNFVLVFEQVDEKTRQAMFKLRQTWNDLFPNKKLYTLDVRVNHIDPAWPISAPAPQTATTSIHVNPKFLLKPSTVESHQSSSEVTVLPAMAGSDLLSQRLEEQQKAATAEQELEEARLRQQLIAREELEIMKLEQEKLQVALTEAKSRLEQQDRLLRERQAAPTSRVPASPPLSAVRVSAAVAPCTRDPRTRTDLPVDPRLQSTASFHQTAVVLPTQAKPSSTTTVQPDTATHVEQAASSGTVENIFDRLLKDLNPVKSESVTVPRIASSGTSTSTSELKTEDHTVFAVGSCVSKDETLVREETDGAVRKLSASPRPATRKPGDNSENKSEEMQLKASLQLASLHEQKPNRLETKDSDTRHSDIVCDVSDASSCPPDDDRNGDRHSQRRSGPRSSRRRATCQDQEKSKGAGQLTVDVHSKEKDAGPVAKRMRHDRYPNDSPDSVPSDLMELFGKEDKDYRSLPPIPKLRPLSPRRQPLLGSAPHTGQTSPQSVGWANFKASRPDDFPLDQRDNAPDTDWRKKAPLLPTPLMERRRDGVEEKQLFSTVEESERPVVVNAKDRFLKAHGEERWQMDRGQAHGLHYGDSAAHHPYYGDRPAQDTMESNLHGDSPHDVALRHHGWRPHCEHEEQRALLQHQHPAAEGYDGRMERGAEVELWEAPLKPMYDEDRFYMPDFDVRWRMRAQTVDSAYNTYTVVIDGRHFEMNLNDRPRFIKCHNVPIRVALNGYNSQLVIDGFDSYHFGSLPSSVRIHGATHTVFVQGPQKKLWIDDNLFEINVDAPPEMINIGGHRHDIQIDSASNSVIVDGHHVCECICEGVQDVQLAFVLHKIQFSPPKKEILIDGQLCTLDMTGKYPVVWIDRRPRGIRFDGSPRYIYIDDRPYLVPMDQARKCRIDGPKPRLLAFGGPGHEVIVDDQWFEVKFGGAEKLMKFGGRVHKVQLLGNPPDVKILPEVVMKEQHMTAASGGFADNDIRRVHQMPVIHDGADSRRPAADLIGRDTHRNSPGQNSDALRVRGYMENAPWPARSPLTRRGGDPRLRPDAGPLYGKQSVVTERPPDVAITQPVDWTPGNETSVQPTTSTAQQSTLTPGGSIDVNLLLTQLLAKGMIGQTDASQSTSQPSAAETSSAAVAAESPAASDVSDTDLAKKDEDSVEPIPQISDFVIDNLRKRYVGAIQQLYVGIACSSCGLRFKSDAVDKYTDHLDWHFRQNRREKEDVKVAKCRQWYYDIVDWIQYEEVSSEPADVFDADGFNSSLYATKSSLPDNFASLPNVVICPQASGDENEDICDVCRESFEQCWSEERESWHLKDAISVDGKIYHPVCFEDVKESRANESCSTDDVSEPVKMSDDVTVAEMSELDSCNADNPSSVIGPDRTSIMSSIETSAQPPTIDSSITASDASINDVVAGTAAEPGVGSQLELISSSPSKLVIDTSFDAGDHCGVKNAVKAESLETIVDTNTGAVCETVDEIGCDAVMSESLPVSSDVADTFPSPPTELGVVISGDDDEAQPVASYVEISDAAD